MTVNIDIDLNSRSAQVKLGAMKAQIEALSDDIDFEIDTDSISDKIDKLTDGLNEIDIDVDYSDLKKAAMLKSALEGDIETDLDVRDQNLGGGGGDGIDPPVGSGRGFDHQRHGRSRDAFDTDRVEAMMDRITNRSFGGNQSGFRRFEKPEFTTRIERISSNQRTSPGDDGFPGPDLFGRSDDSSSGSNIGSLFGGNKRGKSFVSGGIKEKIREAIPSMNTFYNLLAAIIPILIVVGTQLAGIAASMGAVALAGGSILALGLVGHGEDMASSWQKAQEQLSTLKEEMFETFQPTMQMFAPIQAEFFDRLPRQMNKVANSMQGLTAYSDTLFASLRGITDWIAEVFDVISQNEGKISQLALRFGELAGSSLIDFFEFIVQEAYESQDMLVKFGVAIKSILKLVYNFLKALVAGISALSMFSGIISFVAGLLNNKLIAGLFGFVTVMISVVYVTATLAKSLATLATIGSGAFLTMIANAYVTLTTYIMKGLTAIGVNYGLAASFAAVAGAATMGLGAILSVGGALSAMDSVTPGSGGAGMGGGVGSGMGIGGSGGGSSRGGSTVINEGNDVTVNVGDNMSNKQEKGLSDMFVSDINGTREMN